VEDEVAEEEELEDAFETATLRGRIEEPTLRLSQVTMAPLAADYLYYYRRVRVPPPTYYLTTYYYRLAT
jgi:hypothetical protein